MREKFVVSLRKSSSHTRLDWEQRRTAASYTVICHLSELDSGHLSFANYSDSSKLLKSSIQRQLDSTH